MYIYIFGSICRGEYTKDSDIDLLLIAEKYENINEFDSSKFSIYTIERLKELWNEGNPFAWHLYLESRLVFSGNQVNLIESLGSPNRYQNGLQDLNKFLTLYLESYNDLLISKNSSIFNLSCIFLAIRNFATCYSLHIEAPIFSKKSPLKVKPNLDLPIEVFNILERCRTLSTRGLGEIISSKELEMVMSFLPRIYNWMKLIIGGLYGRV